MGDSLTLLGALVATRCLTPDDAERVADFCRFADESDLGPATIWSAIDLAMDFLNEDPNVAEAQSKILNEVIDESAPHGNCCECGEALTEQDIMNDIDYEMMWDLWQMAREMVRLRDSGEIEGA